jgi:hypothetical protein
MKEINAIFSNALAITLLLEKTHLARLTLSKIIWLRARKLSPHH